MPLPAVPPPPVTGNRAFDAWANLLWLKLGGAGLLASDLSIGGNAATADAATTAVTAVTATTADSAAEADSLAASYTVPVAQGGTDATTAADARTNLGVVATADIRTTTEMLTSPSTGIAGDFEDTVVTWPSPMPDATYSVTATFIDTGGLGGFIAVIAQTANDVTVRLTNSRNADAAGDVSLTAIDV